MPGDSPHINQTARVATPMTTSQMSTEMPALVRCGIVPAAATAPGPSTGQQTATGIKEITYA